MSEAVWDLDELLEDLRKRATEADLPAVPELLAAIEEFRLGLDWDWDWETILAKVAAAREAVDQFERTVVRSARLEGETWDSIADGLNSNRHTVRYRYGRNDLEELDRLDQAHDAESQVALSRLRALQARGVTDPGQLEQAIRAYLELSSRHLRERSEMERELRATKPTAG